MLSYRMVMPGSVVVEVHTQPRPPVGVCVSTEEEDKGNASLGIDEMNTRTA